MVPICQLHTAAVSTTDSLDGVLASQCFDVVLDSTNANAEPISQILNLCIAISKEKLFDRIAAFHLIHAHTPFRCSVL